MIGWMPLLGYALIIVTVISTVNESRKLAPFTAYTGEIIRPVKTENSSSRC